MSEITLVYEKAFSVRCLSEENEFVTSLARKAFEREFSPTDLFAASLGACVLMVMGLQCEKLGVDFEGTKAFVEKEMASSPRRIASLKVSVISKSLPSLEVREKLEEVARSCPVHNSLHPDLKQEFFFTWGNS